MPRCLLLIIIAFLLPACTNSKQASHPTPPPTPSLSPFWQEVPSAAYKFEMRPIPASPDGAIKPFYLATTELTWEAFDVFVYHLDEETLKPLDADAVTRPSKPYLPPDRGYGHEGYAAISLSFHNAEAFCVWLSARSGRHYRLPTAAEWQYACGNDPSLLTDYAWTTENSDGTPHPVGKKKPNSHGLYDMHGNIAEWCSSPSGPVARGGSWADPAPDCLSTSSKPYDPAWNATDPQIPKSKWWLTDAPFVGFRVVCEP